MGNLGCINCIAVRGLLDIICDGRCISEWDGGVALIRHVSFRLVALTEEALVDAQ